VIARFYELKTNTKGTRVGGPRSASHISKTTNLPFDGYEITYSDKHVIKHYSLVTSAEPLESIGREYKRVVTAGPATLGRPDKLRGLTPGTSPSTSLLSATQLSERVQAVISSLDERGTWVQQGNIGGPELVIPVIPARDMVAVIGDKVMPLKEDETLAAYEGTSTPIKRVIHSGTFAANLRLLADYLTAH
jgi:hypothetical protein